MCTHQIQCKHYLLCTNSTYTHTHLHKGWLANKAWGWELKKKKKSNSNLVYMSTLYLQTEEGGKGAKETAGVRENRDRSRLFPPCCAALSALRKRGGAEGGRVVLECVIVSKYTHEHTAVSIPSCISPLPDSERHSGVVGRICSCTHSPPRPPLHPHFKLCNVKINGLHGYGAIMSFPFF